jgi:hypothetical protein
MGALEQAFFDNDVVTGQHRAIEADLDTVIVGASIALSVDTGGGAER